MGRRSFFFKNYVMHLLLIVCAFAVAGGVFYYQMSNYALASKQAELRTTVQSLAEQTKLMQGTDSDIIREIYMLSIGRVAKEDAITVLRHRRGRRDPDGRGPERLGDRVQPPAVHDARGGHAAGARDGQLCRGRPARRADRPPRATPWVRACRKRQRVDISAMVFVYTQDAGSGARCAIRRRRWCSS